MAWMLIDLKRITLTALFLFSAAIDLLIDLPLLELIGGRLAEERLCSESFKSGGWRMRHTFGTHILDLSGIIPL